jgi:hypothetical protein
MLQQPSLMPDNTWHTSVHSGDDGYILDILIDMHAPPYPVVMDATYNRGVMWKNSRYSPDIKADRRYVRGVSLAADFFALPIRSSCIDVLVFDPPHLPTNAASVNSSKIWEERYGITSMGQGRTGDNVSGMFPPFLAEAKRVLAQDGVALVKIADLIHNHRYQWQHVDMICMAQQAGLTACDMMIKVNNGNLKSSKWDNQRHLRKAHSFWMVLRNSKKCERRTVQ